MSKTMLRRLAVSLTVALAGTLLVAPLLHPPLARRPSKLGALAGSASMGLNEVFHRENRGASNNPARPADSDDHYVFLPSLQGSSERLEARALWVTRWDYSTASDVQALVEDAAAAGFNMILFQVRGTADAFYASSIEPWAARLSGTLGQDPGWDPLQTAVDAAHARGVQLHAYINVYPVWAGTDPPPEGIEHEHLFWTLTHDPRWNWPDWRVWTCDGSDPPYMLLNSGYLWATPALADVENRVVALAADLVTRYHVDGLHLDLVRYPGPNYSCDPFTEAALVESGLPRADWQRQRVTQLVSRVYSDVIVPRPGVRLSAAVWPVYQDHWDWGYSEGYSDYYQDSQGWIGSGVIDAILPMIYPANVFESWDKFTLGQFSISASDFLDSDGGRHVFPGISAQYASFAEIAQRIAIARDLGAPGHAIFSARLVTGDYWCAGRAVCHDPYWDDFAAGPYATPARIPPLTWRW